jgi:hypothetical protein
MPAPNPDTHDKHEAFFLFTHWSLPFLGRSPKTAIGRSRQPPAVWR